MQMTTITTPNTDELIAIITVTLFSVVSDDVVASVVLIENVLCSKT